MQRTFDASGHRAAGRMRWALAAAVVVFLIGGCSDDDPAPQAGGDNATQAEGGDRLEEALTAHAEGRVDEATDAYNDVLEDDPENKYAHYNLGLLDQDAGRAEDAEARYREALSSDENFTSALFNLAILLEESDAEESEELYRKVIEVEPDNASAHLNLGFLLLASDEQAEGEAELERAVDLDPELATRVPDGDPEDADEPVLETTTTTR